MNKKSQEVTDNEFGNPVTGMRAKFRGEQHSLLEIKASLMEKKHFENLTSEEVLERSHILYKKIQNILKKYNRIINSYVEKGEVNQETIRALRNNNATTRINAGFDDYYAQFDKILAAFVLGNPPVDIETVGPYACAHIDPDTRKLSFSKEKLPKDEKVGLLLASVMRELSRSIDAKSTLISLIDEYNDYTSENLAYSFSKKEQKEYKKFVTELFLETGAITGEDQEGEDYIILLESDQLKKIDSLIELLENSGRGIIKKTKVSGGKEKVQFYPSLELLKQTNLSKERRKEMKKEGILLSLDGTPTCQALDASGFLGDQNKDILHFIMLGDHMRSQQDKVYTLLSALGITNDEKFHNAFFKSNELPAEVIVFALVTRLQDKMRELLDEVSDLEVSSNGIRKEIRSIIRNCLDQLGYQSLSITVENIEYHEYGSFATNIAMQLASNNQENPRKIAEKIANYINNQESELLEIAEVAGPGFINFRLKHEYVTKFLTSALEKKTAWGSGNITLSGAVLLEHSSPNLFKPFHIGHLVNNFVGSSIGNLLSFVGYEVQEIAYPSDVSPGIAKAVWALMKNNKRAFTIDEIGKAYVKGSEAYENEKTAFQEIQKINQIIYDREESDALFVYEKGIDISLNYYKEIMALLRSKPEGLIFESESGVAGKEIVLNNTPGVFTNSREAIIFEGSKYGLFDNVFVTSAGNATYLAKDIGLVQIKDDRYVFDKSITVTDIEQKDHFLLVKKAGEFIDQKLFDRSEYVHHGRLRLTGGKISSRKGNVPLATDLIDVVTNRIIAHSPDNKEIDQGDIHSIALSALKYSILKSSIGKNMVFDLEKSLSLEGDTGPYLLYAHVRATSVLRRAENLSMTYQIKSNLASKTRDSADSITKTVMRFPDVIEKALLEMRIHHVATYLHELAYEFNKFYGEIHILDKENPDSSHNLAIVKLVQQTLENGMSVLGIKTVEKM